MKNNLRVILGVLTIVLFSHLISSCDAEKIVTYLPMDLGILHTDENGNIIGGDYSDWCMASTFDTFTYVSSFKVTILSNRTARLNWITSKEYHNYGFDLERKRFNDHSFTKIKFIPGQGIKKDSTFYTSYDSVFRVQDYIYRLKVIDIFNNYKYVYSGQIQINSNHVSFFGPIYPNPARGKFTIPFGVSENDFVSIYFIYNSDTVFVTQSKYYTGGTYRVTYYYDTSKYRNTQCRLYILNNSLNFNDSCKSYGDIQFE